jgi:hypothetical protein
MAHHLTIGDAGGGVLGPQPRSVIGPFLDIVPLGFDELGGEQAIGV